MPFQYGGYRQYLTATATATTHSQDFPEIPEGHKVYWTRASCRVNKDNADCVFYIVSGGQEFAVQNHKNMVDGLAAGQMVNTWIYAGEHIRVKWQEIASADVVECWIVGDDKWEKNGT